MSDLVPDWIHMLSLAEKVFLLSLDERRGSIRIPSSIPLPFSLAGAVLVQMVQNGSARIDDGRLIPLAGSENGGDDQIGFALERINQAEKPKKVNHWVYLLGVKGRQIPKNILASLVEKGILMEEGKYFRWGHSPCENSEGSPLSKYLLKREIRDVFFCDEVVSEEHMALVTLMDSCDMLNHLFTVDEIIAMRKKIKALKLGGKVAPDFLDLLELVRSAIEYAIAAAISV